METAKTHFLPSGLSMRPERGFTLVEILISVVVSSLAIATLYAAYDIVDKQYGKIRDVAVLSQSGRNILAMMKRDIRMAGFTYRDDTGKIIYGSISEPIKISDSGNRCCDDITVVYDYQIQSATTKRLRIRYWVDNYIGTKGVRGRLYKQTDILQPSATTGSKEPMADYIEDLQFVREKVSTSGSIQNLAKTSTDLSKSGKLTDGQLGCNRYCGRHCENGWTYGPGLNPGEKISANFSSPVTIGGIGLYLGEGGETGSGYLQIKEGSGYKKIATLTNIGTINNNAKYSLSTNVTTDNIEFVMTSGGGGDRNLCVFEFEIYPGSNLSNLVDVVLALRTRNEYGLSKAYAKKTYRKGNFKLNKTDAYRRDEYSTTVLVRNLAL